MDKNTITLILSITTVLISIATFSVAYSQMKIASAKTKLDLYNKRFNIYIAALDYYQATWYKSLEEIKEKSIDFTKSYRESQFLFEESDGVYETLGKIQRNGSQIYTYEEHKYEIENNLTRDRLDLDSIDFLHKSFFNQFNCLSFTQSKLYMPASKLNRRFNLLRRFLYTQDKILKHFILPNTCST